MKLLPMFRRLAEGIAESSYKFIEEKLLLSDSLAMRWSLQTLEKTYDVATKQRRFLECKRLKLILQATQKLKPGVLLRTRYDIATRTNVSIHNFSDRKWITVPEGEYVMYLDVVFDKNYDVPTLQILWNDRVVYLHHDNKLGEDFAKLSDYLEVMRPK